MLSRRFGSRRSHACHRGGVAPARIELRRPTLEDVFVAIVDGTTPVAGDERTRLRASLREGSHITEVRR